MSVVASREEGSGRDVVGVGGQSRSFGAEGSRRSCSCWGVLRLVERDEERIESLAVARAGAWVVEVCSDTVGVGCTAVAGCMAGGWSAIVGGSGEK